LKQNGQVSKQYIVGRPSTTLSGTRSSCTPEGGFFSTETSVTAMRHN